MHGWPNWLYWIWAQMIRALLTPIVIPVRIYERFQEK